MDGMTVPEMVALLRHRADSERSKARRLRAAAYRLKVMSDDAMQDAMALGESQSVDVPYLNRAQRRAAADHEVTVAESYEEEAEVFASIAAALESLSGEKP